MPSRLVALDGGSDIPLQRSIMVVGRHPQCDVRLDSLRISRHHCCMSREDSDLMVRDLGSTNGIRVNGERVAKGRLRPGDELSIAHIRYRLEVGPGQEPTIAEPVDGGDSTSPAAACVPRIVPRVEEIEPGRPLDQVIGDGPGRMPENYPIQVFVPTDRESDRGEFAPDRP